MSIPHQEGLRALHTTLVSKHKVQPWAPDWQLAMPTYSWPSVNNSPFIPELWIRFTDDIFMVQNHPQEELSLFKDDLNRFNPSIKFTLETSQVHFLNVIVYKDEGTLQTKLYTKETVSHQYLNYTSCHLKYNKRSILYI